MLGNGVDPPTYAGVLTDRPPVHVEMRYEHTPGSPAWCVSAGIMSAWQRAIAAKVAERHAEIDVALFVRPPEHRPLGGLGLFRTTDEPAPPLTLERVDEILGDVWKEGRGR